MSALFVDPTWLPPIDKARDAHKYHHGHALVLAGGPGQGGAARLAARAALRVGAGAVTLLAPRAAMAENAAQLNAVMLSSCDTPDALTSKMSDPRVSALCLGPGMGLGVNKAQFLGAAFRSADDKAFVLDADALTHLARDASLRASVPANTVLTPHAGEFARLFPMLAAELAAPATRGPAYSKLDAVRAAARQIGCTLLLKGPDTVIATPDGQVALNAACYDRAVPWLATAGAGDVLAGLISGLLARGFLPFHAACWGAWLHVECARYAGPGLIAEDLPEMIPKTLAKLIAQL